MSTDHEMLRIIEQRAKVQEARNRLRLAEVTSLIFGTSQTSLDLVNEDMVSDDGEVWDEVGIRGSIRGRGRMHPVSQADLDEARAICRNLAQTNGYAAGALEARVSYIVGTGLSWKVVAKDTDMMDSPVVEEGNKVIEEFADMNEWPAMEQEFVVRADRDGEVFMRFFRVPDGIAVRFVEPEDVRDPDAQVSRLSQMGVVFNKRDVLAVDGYYIIQPSEDAPIYVPAYFGKDDPQIVHFKANVDANSLRGWPTLWIARRNFARAQRILRNMSYVSGLQAGIALIRKHERATESEAESFVSGNSDLLVTNSATGKNTYHQKILPGSIIDTGPGVSYEAPISTARPESYVPIIQADLREIAAALQMPEYMLTGSAENANLASTLVSEAPATKNFERLQASRCRALRHGPEAAIQRAIRLRRLPATFWDEFDLVSTKPMVASRNSLVETQKREIENRNGVLSIRTWRGQAGLDDATERRNIEEEKEESAQNMERFGLAPNGDTEQEDGEPNGETKNEKEGPPPSPFPGKRKDDEEVGVPRRQA